MKLLVDLIFSDAIILWATPPSRVVIPSTPPQAVKIQNWLSCLLNLPLCRFTKISCSVGAASSSIRKARSSSLRKKSNARTRRK